MAKISKKVVDSTVKEVIEKHLWNGKVVIMAQNNYCVFNGSQLLASFHIYKQHSILFVEVHGSYPRLTRVFGDALEELEARLELLKCEENGSANND